jgi:hypothetical protein
MNVGLRSSHPSDHSQNCCVARALQNGRETRAVVTVAMVRRRDACHDRCKQLRAPLVLHMLALQVLLLRSCKSMLRCLNYHMDMGNCDWSSQARSCSIESIWTCSELFWDGWFQKLRNASNRHAMQYHAHTEAMAPSDEDSERCT